MTNGPKQFRILVLDDEMIWAKLIKEMAPATYDVDIASDVPNAMSQLSAGHYDLVITDIVMPEINGFQFLKKLRADGNFTPAIVISGRMGIEMQARAWPSARYAA